MYKLISKQHQINLDLAKKTFFWFMFLNSCCSLLHILHSETSSANKLVSVHWGNLTMCSVSFGMYLQFYFYMSWLFTRYLTCIFESSVKIISHYAFFFFYKYLTRCMQPVEKISCEQFLHFVDNYPPISSLGNPHCLFVFKTITV